MDVIEILAFIVAMGLLLYRKVSRVVFCVP